MKKWTSSDLIVSFAYFMAALGAFYYLFREEEITKPSAPTEGGLGLSDEEKELFIPSNEWKPVQDHHVCPPGLEYRLNMTDGTRYARMCQ
jgi:hypothetical protein